MIPGETFVANGTTYHVRAVNPDGTLEVIEDGVGEPGNLEYEPGPDVLKTATVDAAGTPTLVDASEPAPAAPEPPAAPEVVPDPTNTFTAPLEPLPQGEVLPEPNQDAHTPDVPPDAVPA